MGRFLSQPGEQSHTRPIRQPQAGVQRRWRCFPVPPILRAMLSDRFSHPLILAALVFGTALLCVGCGGEKRSRPTDGNPVVVSVEVVPLAAVPGEAVTLVWRFALAKDWHLYWAGRNDSGFPPRVDLELPAGWVAGGLQWPVPERYVSPGDILDHVYFEELVLVQKLGAPDDATVGGSVAIEADIQWLACKDMCVPGKTVLTLSIPVRSHVAMPDPDRAAAAVARLPGPLGENALVTRWEGSTFHIGHAEGWSLTFMPTDDCGQLVDLLKDGQGDHLALRFKPKGETVGPVRGLITIEDNSGKARAYRINFPTAALADVSSGG
jgi:DsbC/DsbD-like thiol-disulfide interchange protein